MDIDDANDPKMTGAPGRTIWQNAMPASASASVCVADAATVTGAIAPPRMNGVMSMIWFASAYALAEPSMLKSQDIGEFALARPMITCSRSRVSAPNRTLTMSTESWARLGCVTEPMNALSV